MTSERDEKDFLEFWKVLGHVQCKKVLYTFSEDADEKTELEIWWLDGSYTKMEFKS